MSSSAGGRLDLEDTNVRAETLRAWSIHLGTSRVDPDQLRRRIGEGDLPAAFALVAARNPHAPALTMGEVQRTHGELELAAGASAAWLAHLGIGLDSRVLLIAVASIDVVISYLAMLRLGASVALADPSLTTDELSRMAKSVEVGWVIGSGDALERASRIEGSSIKDVVGLGPDDKAITSTVMGELPDQSYPVRPLDPDRPAILAFTSGTTGQPKCAPLSHRNLLSSIRGVMWAWRWSSEDHLVHSLPISHQHGLGGIHATLLAGSQATILDRFAPRAILQIINQRQATALFAVPAMHERLLSDGGEDLFALRRLRFSTSGSAPLSVDLARRIEAVSGQLPLERYGSTESGLDVSNPFTQRIPGRVGLPLPGVEIALVTDAGEQVAMGEPGEILVRGPQVFSGYRGNEDGLVSGWFPTGDIGVVDEANGYLGIVGRRKELIITGGMNVYPRELEDVLLDISGVRDVAVVGVPSRRWGEEVVAFVVAPGVAINTLHIHAAERLAPYKLPKRILVVESIPRSETGKVDKALLSEAASAQV